MTKPRAADDFATIRARLEELRRERAQAFGKEARGADETTLGGRGLLKGNEGRQRTENEHGPPGSSNRRYGSGH